MAVVIFIVVVTAVDAQAVCETANSSVNNFTTQYRIEWFGSPYNTYMLNLNKELGDYGLIFEDAKNRDCAGGGPTAGASQALLAKINNTFNYNYGQHNDAMNRQVGPYQGWLEGAHVTLIFSSALLIGGHGDLKSDLDTALQRVRDSYVDNPDGSCGFYKPDGWLTNGGNTCMDDHSIAASAWAWIAAYEAKRGRSSGTYVANARRSINRSFSTYDSVCISDPSDQANFPINYSTRGPCNVHTAASDPVLSGLPLTTLQQKLLPLDGTPPGEILSINRGQNVPYGAGLMTSISSALLGLEEAGAATSLTPQQQVIAAAFLAEAQSKSDPTGSYFKGGADAPGGTANCARYVLSGGSVIRNDNQYCGDNDTRPRIFNLTSEAAVSGISSVYERFVNHAVPSTVYDRANGVPVQQNAYAFNQFQQSYFTKNANVTTLNWGREVYYHYLGWGWHTVDPNAAVENTFYPSNSTKRPRLWAYLDQYNPIGYLDGISSTGVATGWTCDQDLPGWSNYVDFTVNGGSAVLRVKANVGSEQAVFDLCGSGYAHRFSAQLPSYTKGQLIHAYGLDATWRGFTNLPGWQCSANPACTW